MDISNIISQDVSDEITDCVYQIKLMLQGGYNRNKYVLHNLHYGIDGYTHWGEII